MSDEDVSAVSWLPFSGFVREFRILQDENIENLDPNSNLPQMVAPVEMDRGNAQNTSIKNENGDQNAKAPKIFN